jgi:uroporphyrinogen III methyltransferase / synthase
MSGGICHLVGAGPGDPGLLTLKGRECLADAQVVVFDYLANPELLGWAPEGAGKICAGKEAGRHAMTQDEINALLVEKTRQGLRVVRLKGGDPFVFGRGGEEAEALARAGCAFEVVPGVSSALAGPACAGIPVTHRAHTSAVTIFTGHEDPAKGAPTLDYAALAAMPGTKVMLMGIGRLAAHCEALAGAGMPPDTPVALVRHATTPRQETLTGTLGTIADKAAQCGFRAPAVAVFGDVVGLRKTLGWFEERPLFGRRVAVTRTRRQAGELVARLRALGADAFEMPTIRIEPAPDKRAFYELVADAHTYDWVIFTSPNGVDAFFRAFFEIFKDAREIGGVRIAAIGPATAARVRAFHLAVDFQPETYVAEAILEGLRAETSVENLKFLLARAEGAREVLAEELTRMGAIVDEAVAYRTVPETGDPTGGVRRFREEGADMITFTSSSTVRNFKDLGLPVPAGLVTASIGPVTSATMREMGLPVDIEAGQHDIPGLVRAIVAAGQVKSS